MANLPFRECEGEGYVYHTFDLSVMRLSRNIADFNFVAALEERDVICAHHLSVKYYT